MEDFGCGEKEDLRWVRNDEFYSCYDCFYHDLDCESSVMVPPRGADQLDSYITEGEWDERCKDDDVIDKMKHLKRK